MQPTQSSSPLDRVHHVALEVSDVAEAAAWYRERFRCRIEHQDETWALLGFANVRLALVTKGDHPPHLGFVHARAEDFGPLKPHRDGTRSVYLRDPGGNSVEMLAPEGPLEGELG